MCFFLSSLPKASCVAPGPSGSDTKMGLNVQGFFSGKCLCERNEGSQSVQAGRAVRLRCNYSKWRRTEGKVGWKNPRLLCGLWKFLQSRQGLLKLTLAIRGVLGVPGACCPVFLSVTGLWEAWPLHRLQKVEFRAQQLELLAHCAPCRWRSGRLIFSSVSPPRLGQRWFRGFCGPFFPRGGWGGSRADGLQLPLLQLALGLQIVAPVPSHSAFISPLQYLGMCWCPAWWSDPNFNFWRVWTLTDRPFSALRQGNTRFLSGSPGFHIHCFLSPLCRNSLFLLMNYLAHTVTLLFVADAGAGAQSPGSSRNV